MAGFLCSASHEQLPRQIAILDISRGYASMRAGLFNG
jgi:hypothetical protein